VVLVPSETRGQKSTGGWPVNFSRLRHGGGDESSHRFCLSVFEPKGHDRPRRQRGVQLEEFQARPIRAADAARQKGISSADKSCRVTRILGKIPLKERRARGRISTVPEGAYLTFDAGIVKRNVQPSKGFQPGHLETDAPRRAIFPMIRTADTVLEYSHVLESRAQKPIGNSSQNVANSRNSRISSHEAASRQQLF
jgi:hypothetical protein